MVKLGCRPICSAYSRSSLAPIAWNVPAQVSASVMMPALAPSTLAQMLSTRRLISDAARREKVISRDAARIDAVDDQIGDPVRQGVGLARSPSGDDEQRRG
jgi:hypothetical protein